MRPKRRTGALVWRLEGGAGLGGELECGLRGSRVTGLGDQLRAGLRGGAGGDDEVMVDGGAAGGRLGADIGIGAGGGGRGRGRERGDGCAVVGELEGAAAGLLEEVELEGGAGGVEGDELARGGWRRRRCRPCRGAHPRGRRSGCPRWPSRRTASAGSRRCDSQRRGGRRRRSRRSRCRTGAG